MKSRLIEALFIMIFGGVMLYFTYDTVNSYQLEIDERDIIIEKQFLKEDSLRNSNLELLNAVKNLFDDEMIDSDGKFDTKKFIEYHYSLKDSIKTLQYKLDMIQRNYGVYVSKKDISDTRVTYTIQNSEKIDSALIALEFFGNRLVKNGNEWTIDVAGKDYKELSNKFSKLQESYKNSVAKRNSDVKIYRDILIELSKKGHLKIDSSGNEFIYKY